MARDLPNFFCVVVLFCCRAGQSFRGAHFGGLAESVRVGLVQAKLCGREAGLAEEV